MPEQTEEDVLFEKLAKSLDAVRHDAELARSGGAAGVSASLSRLEAELRRLASEIEATNERITAQEHSSAARDSVISKITTELQALRQSIEAPSPRARQPKPLAASSKRFSMPVGRIAAVLAAVIILVGGTAAWIAQGWSPTPAELGNRVSTRFAQIIGLDGPPPPPPPINSVTEQAPAVAVPAPAPARQPSSPAVQDQSSALAPAPVPAEDANAQPTAAQPKPEVPILSPNVAPTAIVPTGNPGQQAAGVGTSTPSPAVTAENQPRQVLLRATSDAWVDVRQKSGRSLLRKTMRAGETWSVPADSTLLLSSGNAAALELVVNGVATRISPARGSSVRDMPLDPDAIAASSRSNP